MRQLAIPYVVQRALLAVAQLAMLSVLVFVLTSLLPGDAAERCQHFLIGELLRHGRNEGETIRNSIIWVTYQR